MIVGIGDDVWLQAKLAALGHKGLQAVRSAWRRSTPFQSYRHHPEYKLLSASAREPLIARRCAEDGDVPAADAAVSGFAAPRPFMTTCSNDTCESFKRRIPLTHLRRSTLNIVTRKIGSACGPEEVALCVLQENTTQPSFWG